VVFILEKRKGGRQIPPLSLFKELMGTTKGDKNLPKFGSVIKGGV
jgi:hypothetical protein